MTMFNEHLGLSTVSEEHLHHTLKTSMLVEQGDSI